MSDPLAPLPRDAFDFKAAQHLLNRAGFGGTPSRVRALAALGIDGAVNSFFPRRSTAPTLAQLARQFRSEIVRPLSDSEKAQLRAARMAGDEATLSRFSEREIAMGHADIAQAERVRDWWTRRLLVEADNAFEEKMVLFWHGHFASAYWTVRNSWHMLMQMDLFRREHAGSFERLVRGIVRDPAMLKYLDGISNVAGRPNENLARELLELFTMGEGNGYTETDVKQAARALTGWTIRGNSSVFDRSRHDEGAKTIFGQTGAFGADTLVNAIMRREQPPKLLATKIYRFFVNDHPRPSLESAACIDALAREIRRNTYQMRPVLTKLFRSQHFYAASNRLSVVKSPIQLLAQMIRSLGAPMRDPKNVRFALGLMGQIPLQPPNVKGWDGGRKWCSTSSIAARQNACITLLTGMMAHSGTRGRSDDYRPTVLLADLFEGQPPSDVRACLAGLAEFTLAKPLNPSRLDALVSHVQRSGGVLDDETLRGVLCLLSALPEHQLC